MIDVNFKGLFTIQIMHKFYANLFCNDFIITPSTITSSVMSGHRLVARQYNNQLYIGTQFINSQPPPPPNQDVPLIPVEQGMQMTFYVALNNPLFFNYTNLPSFYDPGKIYYFTNRNNNVATGTGFLSAKATYNNTVTYLPGDIAADGSGVSYRAIQTSSNSNQHNVTDTAYWVKVDNNSYASSNDLLQWIPSVSTYNFSSLQSNVSVAVLGYDTAANTYTLPVLSAATTFGSPASSFTLDLSTLSPGKYSLTINGVQQWIYLNDELSTGRPFAVIDIFNEISPASCNLVDVNGYILSPVYAIYFMNRATIWKYIIASGNSYTITNSSPSPYLFTGPASTITSLLPIPLSNQPLDMNVNINSNAIPVASADPQRLSSVGDSYLYSEIYLNY